MKRLNLFIIVAFVLSALVVWIFSLNIKLQKADNTNKELEINANKINKFLPSVLKTIDNFILYETHMTQT